MSVNDYLQLNQKVKTFEILMAINKSKKIIIAPAFMEAYEVLDIFCP